MSDFLFYYHGVSPTTWVYLSSLLMIGLFFKFSRFWSVRNLDLILLILLAPGLLLVSFGRQIQQSEIALAVADASARPSPSLTGSDIELVPNPPPMDESGGSLPESDEPVRADSGDIDGDGSSNAEAVSVEGERTDDVTSDENARTGRGRSVERLGYLWLFSAGGLLLARLLIDSLMVRRPLLAPNLSVGGLTFIGCSLFVFLMANVVTQSPEKNETVMLAADHGSADVAHYVFTSIGRSGIERAGPGYGVLSILPHGANQTVAILSHLAVVLGIVLIGYWHFDNITMGIGAATLYLMLPYTAEMTGRVDHVLPAAFLVWAILCYPQPFFAGCFLGLASGVVYYPLFLLPLWISFYWQRGLLRFLTAVATVLVILATVLTFTPGDAGYWSDLQRMFGLWPPRMAGLEGFWDPAIGGWDPYFRLPFLAAFMAMCGGMALWPARKNLGTLLSCSAAVMLATQFWHGFAGGTYMAWYLPLTLLTMFRPNLEDRVVLDVLGEGWFPRRGVHQSSVGKAA